MAILKLVTGVDNKILRTPSVTVKKIDRKMKKLAHDMTETLFDCDGLGLAAPQIGQNIRLYIARLNYHTANEMIIPMFNAEFTNMSDEFEEGEEGCLSLPGKFGVVSRAKQVTVKYMDINGKSVTLNLADMNARLMQHEIDHLNGVLIADKMIREIKEEK